MEDVLIDKIRKYYTSYYKDACSLKDYETYVNVRCSEEQHERARLQEIQNKFGLVFTKGQKHFILGGGTGGLGLTLFQDFGCDVFAVEPNADAFHIIQEKFKVSGMNPDQVKKDFGENLSFPDQSFDFIHVVSVLEHVQDVRKTVSELIRVLKVGGRAYLHLPNYAFPYEGHYKMLYPVFLPRFLGRIYLRLRGKSPEFINTINFLSQRKLMRILLSFEEIDFQYLYRGKRRLSGRLSGLWKFYLERLGIYPNQEILITKRAD